MEKNNVQAQYHWYMSGQALYFFAGGIGFVLKQWLIAFYLQETPEILGYAQMIMSLPQLFFILIGGLAADRLELVRHLVRLQVAATLSFLLIIFFILGDVLNVWLIVGVGVLDAIIASFAQPARDSLLNRVSQGLKDRTLQQVVTVANMLQFGAQILGMTVFNLVRLVGPIPLLVLQALLALGAAFTTSKLEPSPAEHKGEASLAGALHDIWDGLKEAFSSPLIRPVILWLGSTGFVAMGIYLVVLPIMVRDIYQGEAFELSLVHASFFIGVFVASYFLAKVVHFRFPGRMLLLAQFGTCSCIVLLILQPALPIFFGSVFLWGCSAALSMTLTRGIIQREAPSTHRARILSVYQLVMFGGSPVGSVIAGIMVHDYGITAVLQVSLGITLTVLTGFTLFSSFWGMERRHPDSVEESSPPSTQ